MEISSNFVDINSVKANPVKPYENLNTSQLEDETLRKVTDDFEAFFMQQLLDISLKNTHFAGEGSGSDIIKGMYTEAVSRQSSGTVGISDKLYNILTQK